MYDRILRSQAKSSLAERESNEQHRLIDTFERGDFGDILVPFLAVDILMERLIFWDKEDFQDLASVDNVEFIRFREVFFTIKSANKSSKINLKKNIQWKNSFP